MTQNRGAIFPRKIKNNLGYEVPNGYDELFKETRITFLNKKERREPFKKELSVKKEILLTLQYIKASRTKG